MRIFAAIVPPEEVTAHLDDFLDVRREAAAFRWTRAEQGHLTLAFAAEAPERALDEISERLDRAAARHSPFVLRIGGGGAFPNPARAKVLYADVVPADPDDLAMPAALDELGHLARSARSALAKAGAAVDGQRFRPHLTLARLGHPEEVSNWVRLLDAYEGPAWTVDEIELVASHLGEGPRRTPRYESLETFSLSG
ncbi:RNA 2',3'-cyclic phosphodiesterase [Nocardioides jiangxiensis]|uniref:RNA 2',3'-cyclic phosphodiesterase n=1 Tax=Nocardioides jiangxiensis TaxID=3064524 RepID=A0ABT9B0G7_9ACTN|nr:RNA 2',3'-cyclic phosphodiesterase [Nocardioides sp. WY-20]MDO7868346.1 RNA 2',3'-cyclic phosphodiesterase [Nocardioides sp. WY-20]